MRPPPDLHGILVVDKPRGWTSHDVVARVRRVAKQRQVGHAGTLDPMATGVLVLGLGQATRLLEYLLHASKSYEATVHLGVATDTFDADGAVTSEAPWRHVTREDVVRTLLRFTGEIEQQPPVYSAIKQRGQPLHRLVRRGATVQVQPRRVTVQRLNLESFEPPELRLLIDCGSGTYVRSLAHDLGIALGSAAHLTALRRTRVGRFGIDEARGLDDVVAEDQAAFGTLLCALDRPVWDMRALILDPPHVEAVACGRRVRLDTIVQNEEDCRAYGPDGTFLALMRYDSTGGDWQPHKVFLTHARGTLRE